MQFVYGFFVPMWEKKTEYALPFMVLEDRTEAILPQIILHCESLVTREHDALSYICVYGRNDENAAES